VIGGGHDTRLHQAQFNAVATVVDGQEPDAPA
jgi:hypothetical protein